MMGISRVAEIADGGERERERERGEGVMELRMGVRMSVWGVGVGAA